jgi:hypothetical protein
MLCCFSLSIAWLGKEVMSSQQSPIEPLGKLLAELLTAATAVWDAYRDVGPGKVEASLFEPVEVASQEIDRLLDDSTELREAVAELYDLAQRCTCRSEGLCFITGEAGLIPRRDKEAAFEERLAWLRTTVG